jgi:hypothetical protein
MMILWAFFAVLALLTLAAMVRGGLAGLLRLLFRLSLLAGVVFLLAIAGMDLVAAGIIVAVLVAFVGIVVGLLRKILG